MSAAGSIPTLHIAYGVPGSGKTTRFEKEKKLNNGQRWEADDYPELYINGVFNPQMLPKAHEWCQKNVEKSILNGTVDIYQSNTNLNPRDMIPYLMMAQKYGYDVNIVFPLGFHKALLHYEVDVEVDHAMKVLENRSGSIEGQKKIPTFAMNKMIALFNKNILALKSIQGNLTANNNPQYWLSEINRVFPKTKFDIY